MASPEEFADRIRARSEQIAEAVNKLTRGVALVVDRELVTSTPVDTGRARSNWQVSVGSRAEGTVEPTTAEATIAQAEQAVGSRQLGEGIYISNNLPYIERLNAGSSAQAPAGFVQDAVAAGIDAVRTGRVLED